jgi:hypothetical protein
MKTHFDVRFLLLALIINGGAVFFINLYEGGASGASISGIVQLAVSGGLAGFTIPYTRRSALMSSTSVAYRRGSLYMATFVAGIGGLLHWWFETPELFGTIMWNFCLNASAGATLVYLKRNSETLPLPLRGIAKRL